MMSMGIGMGNDSLKENSNISPLTLIMKPTNACNMRCKHCYHADTGYDCNKLDYPTINHLMQITLGANIPTYFIWHGGEPLLMGLPFYQYVVDIESKISSLTNTNYFNSIQTNASLLDCKMVDFLEENNFRIGISFDGPYNDILREQTKLVLENVSFLQKRRVKFACISVLSSKSVNKIIEIYKWFNDLNIDFKFANIFASGAAADNIDLLPSLEEYCDAMINFFDFWIHDKNCKIRVENCFDLVNIVNGMSSCCERTSCLYRYLSVDSYGNIFPCGRAYPEKFNLGNIKEFNRIDDVFKTKTYKELVNSAINRRNKCKENCLLYSYCVGGCNNNAIIEGSIEKNNGYSCKAFKEIFTKIKNTVDIFNKDFIVNSIEKYNPTLVGSYQRKGFNGQGNFLFV